MSHKFFATILTIFPEMFPATLGHSLAGQALEEGIWGYDAINIRDFGVTQHKNVDDKPYGGGNGMVMRADVLGNAIDFAHQKNKFKKIYYMSPRGKPLNQRVVHEIAAEKNIGIICGRFEGIDERIINEYNVEELSLGDFILSGGELAAMTLLDACIRVLPDVLVNQDTLKEESFCLQDKDGNPLLEYPLYTRPPEWKGHKVPDILVSGDHGKVEEWRYEKALEITRAKRPDLIKKRHL